MFPPETWRADFITPAKLALAAPCAHGMAVWCYHAVERGLSPQRRYLLECIWCCIKADLSGLPVKNSGGTAEVSAKSSRELRHLRPVLL